MIAAATTRRCADPADSVASATSRLSRAEPSDHTPGRRNVTRGPETGVQTASSTPNGQVRAARRSATCTPECSGGRHSGTCRKRASRAREKAAQRERSDQNVPAYLSEELGLSEEQKAGVELIARTPIKGEDDNVIRILGSPTMEELLRCVERRQRAALTDGKPIPKGYEWDGILETAWTLPLWQYRRVEEAIQRASIGGRRR